ncbi:hypothetical protein AAA799N04_00545 [Marine Group I thaumarchaeote SCGC AAA799-N04]|uniref:Uncharacterized protein n=1 Tax=Marine Group I thaumarchaeote SCGC AAA799-N04 TaxID=1502293 RepID=A0A081RNV2_9ARCH|nr:hypothetical protein AAA799N04_00545 [Marine Group I thaumarchaeote SCGC AAA799-N04]
MGSKSTKAYWLELRPYQSFKDDWYLKDILPKISDIVFFFYRKDDRTRIIIRTNDSEKSLFEKIDQLEAIEIPEPEFVFRYVKKLRLKRHYAIPIVLEAQRSQLYNVIEQLHKEECLVACYAKKDPYGAASVWSWISNKESKYSKEKRMGPQLQNFIQSAKQKAKDTEFYQCEIILGVQNKEIFELLKMTIPEGISKTKTISQKKFSIRKRCNVENNFPFTTFSPKKPIISSKTFPILNGTELLSVVSLPVDVTKLRVSLGSYVPYSQGPQQPIEDAEI